MRISVDAAREYFEHASQQKGAMITPENLPGEPFEYWARGGVCGVFHPDHWPGVWMAHYGVMPWAWGRTTKPAKLVLQEFWDEKQPDLIIGWTHESNRAAISFAKRLGFFEMGAMPVGDARVIMTGWKSCQ